MKNKDIRVLMVLDSLAVGGTETHVLSVVKVLKKLGITAMYAGASGMMYEAFARIGCPIHVINLSARRLRKIRSHQLSTLITPLKQLMHIRQINVVHVHQTSSGIYAAIAAKELGIPVVFTAHGFYYPKNQIQNMHQYSDAIISVSKPVREYLTRMNIQSELIPNGIDPEDFYEVDNFSIREQLGIPLGTQIIVYASRLSWGKAHVCTMLISAARKLWLEGVSKLHVVIVGDGLQHDDIQKLAKSVQEEVGASFIHMVGSQHKMRNYFSLGDIIVGTGRVALEAMACGKPVLAIGNHGFLGLVTPNTYEQAWSYYFGDHDSICKPSEEQIAESLQYALADKNALQKISVQGRDWVTGQFNIHKIVESIVTLYKQVIELKQQRGGT